MPVITEIQTISETISNIIDFVKENEKVKDDFREYLQTINALNVSPSQLQALSIPYITERTVFSENKTIPEFYISENPNLSEIEKEFCIEIDPEEIDPENFQSAEKMLEMINKAIE